jgi:hypothetical protein
MIINKPECLLTITEEDATPEERAHNLARFVEFQKNVDWFGAHATELRNAHPGLFVCILGQEAFVGDDPIEVVARAKAAHPASPGGSFTIRFSRHQGPKIYLVAA